MSNQGRDRPRDLTIVNEDGLVVNRGTGEVIDQLIEGTQDYPSRSARGVSQSLNKQSMHGVWVIGIKTNNQEAAMEQFVVRVEEVLARHGVRFHRSQSEDLVRRLKAVGVRSQRMLEVLNCVLDSECIRFRPGLRARVRDAFNEVFGPDAIVRVQIAGELRRWGFDELFSVDEVYGVYRELNLLLQELRKRRLVKVTVYGVTLIRAAIADLVLRLVSPSEIADAERLLRNAIDWNRALKLLKQLRGLQYYLERSMHTSNSTSQSP